MAKNLFIAFLIFSMVLLYAAAESRLRSIERELARELHNKRAWQEQLKQLTQ